MRLCVERLCITIGEIRLLQQEISSLTQRRKDFFLIAAVRWRNGNRWQKQFSFALLLSQYCFDSKASKDGTNKKSWRLSVFALSLVAALPLYVFASLR
jgi:hypothetical protein